MLRHVAHRKFKLILLIVGISMIMSLAGFLTSKVDSEGNNPSNYKLLLQQLNERISQQPGFLITVEFRTPLIASETAWTIGDPKDERKRIITDLGDDYVCLREVDGGALFVRCIPFSNIASIGYLDN